MTSLVDGMGLDVSMAKDPLLDVSQWILAGALASPGTVTGGLLGSDERCRPWEAILMERLRASDLLATEVPVHLVG
jgi:hypothetical protein